MYYIYDSSIVLMCYTNVIVTVCWQVKALIYVDIICDAGV